MKFINLLIIVLSISSLSFAQRRDAKRPMTRMSPVQSPYFAGFEYELQTALSNGGIYTYKANDNNYTVIDAQVSLSKVIKSNIQAGAEAHLNNTSGGGSSSYFEIMGFGVYNFDSDLKQSLYAKGGLGLQNIVNSKGSNESKLAIMVGGGKRILILNRLTYNPEARLVLVDNTTRLNILLLNFSLLF
ncbi:MAG: hypothetical protein KDD45_11650 [Bdellovibrionales bacterium]|nr:hypothetical protein [Bdellovibrionales bacterium]